MSTERWVLCVLFDGPGWLGIRTYNTPEDANRAITHRLNKYPGEDSSRYIVVPESTYKAYEKLKDIIDRL